jgi:hypothetical protein
MNIDVKEYAQAKLRCKLSGNASILADFVITRPAGFQFRQSFTMEATGLSHMAVSRAKKELIDKNVIQATRINLGQIIDFNFDFDTWR